MKLKFSIMLIAILRFTINMNAQEPNNNLNNDNKTISEITVQDEFGIEKMIIVEEHILMTRLRSYSFDKPCNDWIGCPERLVGTANGYNYVVYRQYFKNGSNFAYYSGWLYD